jgi:hypothetical protein
MTLTIIGGYLGLLLNVMLIIACWCVCRPSPLLGIVVTSAVVKELQRQLLA